MYPSLTYDNRNHFWNPTEGEYARLQLEGGYAGGNNSDAFGNLTLEYRKYHRGFWKNNTFAYRAIGGIMTDGTKESQRFRVGGGNTLRGYDGSYYRGTQKFIGTIENRTQFTDVFGVETTFSTLTAHTLYSGILDKGSSAELVSALAGLSAK